MEIPKFKVCSFISLLFCTGIMTLHLITYFFAAETWPHSVGTNYVCNLLCCGF